MLAPGGFKYMNNTGAVLPVTGSVSIFVAGIDLSQDPRD